MPTNTERIEILGCPIDNLTLEEAVGVIEEFIKDGTPRRYVAINAGKIVKMRRDPAFRKNLFDGDLNIVDGKPLMWVAKLFGKTVKERYGGLDIIDKLMPLAEKKRYGIYFLGAEEEVIEKAAGIYEKDHPNLRLAWRNGYWTEEEEQKVVEDIKASRSDILFFAMSSPRKEIFLDKYLKEMGIPFVAGVGGAFDIIAGKTKRAPEWMQNIGLEWLFRVLQEPRRLWKRYLIGNSVFMWLVLKEFFRIKILKKNDQQK